MLSEDEKERLRNKTVEVLLELRSMYLQQPHKSILKHWEMLQDRMRAAARTTSNPEEWATDMVRSLKAGSASSHFSTALRSLADDVRERKAAREWLQLVEDEWGYLMAVARGVSESRKEAKEAEHV